MISSTEEFKYDVIRGLSNTPKTLKAKYFYDAQGSLLFEEITKQAEYYLTRCDESILQDACDDLSKRFGNHVSLIEFGSGSSKKTRHLLRGLSLDIYLPLDISANFLADSANLLGQEFPNLKIEPIPADYTKKIELPNVISAQSTKVVFFSGSTIGNFEPPRALVILQNIAELIRDGGYLLIGVDLQKDLQILEAAYNDRAGITAQFNLGILRRSNQELGTNFQLDQFQHKAFYNDEKHRIEMHLRSLKDQEVSLDEHVFTFAKNETIHTENSYKYSLESFKQLAKQAGLERVSYYTDPKSYFSNQLFTFAPHK
ncbi:MAG: L-histidine N(alpha)-methyltransferase [Bdellovibrionales bacterium]|nr:L-histidine N(alpha)-methyltransferase [Bdellovibrionales bacterium]